MNSVAARACTARVGAAGTFAATIFAATIAAAGLASRAKSAAGFQPPASEPVDPQLIIESARLAYRGPPLSEDVTIRVREGDSPSRGGRIGLSVWPDDRGARVRLELGDFVLAGSSDGLVGLRIDAPGYAWTAPVGGPLSARDLAAALPPLALPQIELALGDSASLDLPTPFTPGVWWTRGGVERRPLLGEVAVISGDWPGGEVELVFDEQTSRVAAMECRSIDPVSGAETVLELSVRRGAPPPNRAWPTIDGLVVVPTLPELRPPDPIAIGERVPDWMFPSPGPAWSISGLLAAPDGAPDGSADGAPVGEPAPRPAGLLIVRVSEDPALAGDIDLDASAGLDALREALGIAGPDPATPGAGDEPEAEAVGPADAAEAVGPFTPSARLGIVLVVDGARPSGADPGPIVAAALGQWRARAGPTAHVSWTIAPLGSRFAPGSAVVAAVLGADRSLRGAAGCDGRAGEAGPMAAELRSMVGGG